MTGEGGCEQAGKDLFYSFKRCPIQWLAFSRRDRHRGAVLRLRLEPNGSRNAPVAKIARRRQRTGLKERRRANVLPRGAAGEALGQWSRRPRSTPIPQLEIAADPIQQRSNARAVRLRDAFLERLGLSLPLT